MRFTKIPLIATLMAVALSLLIVLPTLAQVSGDRTDGRVSVGSWLDVRVADNLANIADGTTLIGTTAHATAATPFDAQDTYFDGRLYVSNKAGKVDETTANATPRAGWSGAEAEHEFTEAGAYNTILVTAAVVDGDGGLVTEVSSGFPDDSTTDAVDESMVGCTTADLPAAGTASVTSAAVATIKNLRNNNSVKAYLIDTGTDDGATPSNGSIFQGLVAVWDQEAGFDPHNGPCANHGDPQRFRDNTAAGTADDIEDPSDGWTGDSAAVILARDGDTLQISVAGVSGTVSVIVDGAPPVIDDVTPEVGGTQKSSTINLGFTVSDDGSGIRYDGESGSSTDADLQPHNGDNDNRFDEPITTEGGDGATEDIEIFFATDKTAAITDAATAGYNANPNFDDADESSEYGSNGWTQRMPGVTYDMDMRLVDKKFNTYYWQVTAKDRVGNMATTDADEDKPGDQPYSFNVDDQDPEVEFARTGVGYEAGTGEFRNRSWIALNFRNEGTGDGFGGEDRIAADSVAPGDFTVDGHTVMSVLVPSDKQKCDRDIIDPVKDPDNDTKEDADNIHAISVPSTSPDHVAGKPAKDAVAADTAATPPVEAELEEKATGACLFEPRARVYLQLSDELASDETPTIQLLGGVLKDAAGNNNVTQSIESKEVLDRIAPGVSITVTSDSGATGRVATDRDGSFKVRVESDEDLARFPRLYFSTIEGTDPDAADDKVGAATKLKVAAVTASGGLSLTEKEINVWEKSVDADSLPGGDVDRLLAVIVTATDVAGNSGNSAGWKDGGGSAAGPDAGDALTFKSLDAGGFLVEIDGTMKKATIEVLPPTDPDADKKDKTESTNPYIRIKFSEGNEYGIAVTEAADGDDDTVEETDTAHKADIGSNKSSNTDSHADVSITSLELNGANRLSDLVRVKAGEYVLAVTGLEVGEYEIVYTAQDDVGNKTDPEEQKFTFEVQVRQPYKIELQPGWNLVSFPGDPFNPAVGNVVGDGLKADTVLGYQGGEWVTAVRNEEGGWQGTLTDIRGGYGYWVRTTALESISTVIPPILPTANLPSVPVTSGWNLLGVVDAQQRKAGTTEDADEYFTSLNVWRVGYGFNTQLNQWSKLLPGTDNTVANGKGYWVWSTKAGTLVP